MNIGLNSDNSHLYLSALIFIGLLFSAPGIYAANPIRESAAQRVEQADQSLIYAVMEEDLVRVKVLLAAGADANAKESDGSLTVLMRASGLKDVEIVKALLAAGADVNARSQGWTPLMFAAESRENGSGEIVKALLDAGSEVNATDTNGFTALIFASSKGSVEVIKALLAGGADVKAKSSIGTTALMHGSRIRHGLFGEPVVVEAVQALINAGSEVNAKANDGGTALMDATYSGSVEAINVLLDNGAYINAKDNNGDTVLMYGLKGPTWGWEGEVLQALLVAGADVNAKNKKGETVLQIAKLLKDKDSLINLLEQFGGH